MIWRDLAGEVEDRVRSAPDAMRILEEVSGWSSAELTVNSDERVSERCRGHALGLAERRAAGEPLQYVLGRWGFRSLDLLVDRRVLIPRPETESLAEVAIEEARLVSAKAVADLGTGSGAIALSMAAELPGVEVWGTDVSADALAVARANLAGLGGRVAPRVRLAEGWWFDALPRTLQGSLDVVVSNPPYVAEGEVLPAEVWDWEPPAALYAGPLGTECIASIVTAAPDWLARPGALVVEIAPHQREAALDLVASAGFTDVAVLPDLSGRDRVLRARFGQ